MTQTSNTKRKIFDNTNDTEYPPTKKRRLHISSPTTTPISHLFPNISDHDQFTQVFKLIDTSSLVINMNISHCIIKEISEYATGNFEYCANKKCNESVSVLLHDKTIYNNNHKNKNKVGYVYCQLSNKYYCNDCVYDLTLCDAGIIHFTDEIYRCHYCSKKVCTSHECCYKCECCKEEFCDLCVRDMIVIEINMNEECYVCRNCNDATIIECNRCNVEYDLLYKGHKSLFQHNNRDPDHKKMQLCAMEECGVYICFNCKEEDRNGKYIICGSKKCIVPRYKTNEMGPYCIKHIPNHPNNWPLCRYCNREWK